MALHILTYGEIDRAEWGRLVRESETGTWFQSQEAYGFYESLPELFRPFVVGVKSGELRVKSGELRGVCVGYVTKEKNPIKQFFTRRAIILGGPVLADDASSEEVELLMNGVNELMSERMNGAPIYIETRNFNDYSKWKGAFEKAGFAYKKHLNFHVDCRDEKKMWERLSDNRKRQIKKGTNGANDANGANGENDVREWYGILEKLYRTKVKTPLWPVEFFLEAYRQGVAKFLLVKHESKIIGGSMVVTNERVKELRNEGVKELRSEGVKELRSEGVNGGAVYEWFECGLNGDYKEQYPSVMATWGGMRWAHEHGCARYDMMGAGEPGVPYGVRDFKSEFGGTMVEHGRFLCVCKPWLYKIGEMGVKMMKG